MNRNDVAKVWLTDSGVCVQLLDGRVGFERYDDYTRLSNASAQQRQHYRLSPLGIHWPDIDEDLSYEGFFHSDNITASHDGFRNMAHIKNVISQAPCDGMVNDIDGDRLKFDK